MLGGSPFDNCLNFGTLNIFNILDTQLRGDPLKTKPVL